VGNKKKNSLSRKEEERRREGEVSRELGREVGKMVGGKLTGKTWGGETGYGEEKILEYSIKPEGQQR